jgi:hypothetical protein
MQARMTWSASAGQVDVKQHTATTMQLLLQHLYTGRVQLEAPSAAAQGPPSSTTAQASGGRKVQNGSASVGSRKRDAQGDAKPAGQAGSSGLGINTMQGADNLPKASSELLQLMSAADGYLLQDLCSACQTVLLQQLSTDSALPLLLAAHQAHLQPLKQALMEFVMQHIQGMMSDLKSVQVHVMYLLCT